MKRIKLILTLLVLGLLGLLFYQNQAYFLQPHALSLDFYFTRYTFPEAATGIYWIISFFTGFLLMFLSNIVLRLRAAARIRMLHNQNLKYLETIEDLQKELENKTSPDKHIEEKETPKTSDR